jgi:hypothetical protein
MGWKVECFSLKPNWSLESKLCSFKYDVSLIKTIFSNIFENEHSRDIGRKLFMSNGSPDLYTGITFAILNLSGTTPCSKDLLKI